MTKPKIAILADFPTWIVDKDEERHNGHYTVWLTALHDAFEHQDAFEIHWLILKKGLKAAKHITKKGQYFHILPATGKMVGIFTYYWYNCRQIHQQLREIQPVLLHAWGTEDCYSFAIRHWKGKKILSLQGILTAYKELGPVSNFAKKQIFYEKKAIKSFQHITAESPWAIEQCKKINPHAQYQIFEYAVETPFFHQERSMADHPCCLYAGTNTGIKNTSLIVEAFSRPELSHIQLKLAGPRAESWSSLPSNITALGRMSREEMLSLIAETWCLVHPSLADCAPNIVNEARVMGAPVILTTHCGSQQHVVQGESGYIFQPRDIESFISYVLDICQSQERAYNMGVAHQDICRQKLSKEFMTKQITKLYNSLLT